MGPPFGLYAVSSARTFNPWVNTTHVNAGGGDLISQAIVRYLVNQ